MKMWLEIATLLLLAAVAHTDDKCSGQIPQQIPARILATILSEQDSKAALRTDTPLAATVPTIVGSRLSTSEIPDTKPRSIGLAMFPGEHRGKYRAAFTPSAQYDGTPPVSNYTRAADLYIYGLRKIII